MGILLSKPENSPEEGIQALTTAAALRPHEVEVHMQIAQTCYDVDCERHQYDILKALNAAISLTDDMKVKLKAQLLLSKALTK